MKGHPDLLRLAILDEGPAHGYAVIEVLGQRSDGEFDLPEGTVYQRPEIRDLALMAAFAFQR